jgi:hypothetical protein
LLEHCEVEFGLMLARARASPVSQPHPAAAAVDPCPNRDARDPEKGIGERGAVEADTDIVPLAPEFETEPEYLGQCRMLGVADEPTDARVPIECRCSPGGDGDVEVCSGERRVECAEGRGGHQDVTEAAGLDDEDPSWMHCLRERGLSARHLGVSSRGCRPV